MQYEIEENLGEKWPYLTADLPGIGGRIKRCNEDFYVEEIPLYPPSGSGTHVFFEVEKNGLASCDAAALIAQGLGKQQLDVGFAGRKDKHAITRQWMSVEHVDPSQIQALELKDIRILQTVRHGNKLKVGHLSGNRFRIRIRGVQMTLEKARQITEQCLSILSQQGVPNYFGPQRFGSRNESHLLGYLLIKNELEEFVDLLLGKPELDNKKDFARARQFFQNGDFEKAHRNWPGRYVDQRRVLKSLITNNGNKRNAARAISKLLRSLLICAWQSYLFNQVLAVRMPNIDKLLTGDMAWKHENGACFSVEDAAVEQPRCDRFDISPTGPLLGLKTARLTGPAGAIENPFLDSARLSKEDIHRLKISGARGGRRPFRFQPRNIEIETGSDDLSEFIQLQFELNSGCYATTLLRELMKKEVS